MIFGASEGIQRMIRLHRLGTVFAFCFLFPLATFVAARFAASPVFAKPVARRDENKIAAVYVIPSSHWDLGFLTPPEELMPRLKPHIDDVIANCKADAEFRWTIESIWQLQEWLSLTSDPKLVEDLASLVRSGQIQVSSVWGSMHTEFMGTEQLNRLVYAAESLQDRIPFPRDFAMMDDVPGFSPRLPQLLARSGVKYFLTGSNLFIGGGTSLYPSKNPFYWQSPDGSKILMWQTQGKNGGYPEAISDYFLDPVAKDPYKPNEESYFHPKEWNGLPSLEIMQRGMDKLLKEYERAGYPYDAVLLMYLHDFIPPTWERDQLLPNVRAWNAAGKRPKIVVATPAEFFRHMESKYVGQFPTYSGDWTGLWSEVKTNSPGMSAKARWAQNHIPVAETVASLLSFKTGIAGNNDPFESALISLLKYDEHSGAGQYGWPKIMTREEVEQQNREYAQYTNSATKTVEDALSHDLSELLAERRDETSRELVAAFNPVSWKRSGLVRFRIPPSQLAVRVVDLATGQPLEAQRVSAEEALFLADAVPGFGYRTYELSSDGSSLVSGQGTQDTSVENAYYRLEVRKEDGAVIGWYDKQLNRQLLDPNGNDKMNELLRWQGMKSLPVVPGKISIERRQGPVLNQLVIRRASSYWPETVISLPAGKKEVLVENVLDRTRMPHVEHVDQADVYAFAFPVKFTGSSQLWVGDGIGFHRLPQDYLPGARVDGAVPEPSAVFTSREDSPPFNVTLSQRGSFYVSVPCSPGPTGGCGTFLNELRPNAMRKPDQGDTKDQGVVEFATTEPGFPTTYRYDFALSSASGELDPVSSYRSGAEFELPLLTVKLPKGTRPASWAEGYLSIDSPNVVLLDLKTSADGDPDHFTIRLQEIAGNKTRFKLISRLKITELARTAMTERLVLERNLSPESLVVGPHETLTLRAKIPHERNSWRSEP
jgi:hypothetical protein